MRRASDSAVRYGAEEITAPEEIPPQCGPFFLPDHPNIPFPDFAPSFVIAALPATSRAPAGRARVRTYIQRLLSGWGGPANGIIETPKGPLVPETVQGRKISVSISYAGDTAWIAFAAGAQIGVDAVALSDCAGWEDIAPCYFGTETVQQIKTAPHPRRRFAWEWAILEARCKHAGQPLRENCPPPEVRTLTKAVGDTLIAVAFA
jgi:hypothetical protein